MDTIEDSRSGMMSSKLITYNAYDKTFNTKEFTYTKEYHTLPHLENDDNEYLKRRMELIFDLYINQQIEPVYKTIKFDEIITYLDLIGSRKTVGRIVALR